MHQVGLFFNLGFEGKDAPSKLLGDLARRFGLGGVTHFDRNIDSPAQVRGLNARLRRLALGNPFLISVDQEGGMVQRLKPPRFQRRLPACDVRAEVAFALGKSMGRELKDLAFNAVWTPVLDVRTNPRNPIIGERSFSSDPVAVAQIAGEIIKGIQSEGVLACGKHFPGHGDTSEDSHLTLPVVDHPESRVREVEIFPFRELIGRGLHCVMTAHVLYPALDGDRPATFSEKIIAGLLRKELGFKGIVVTDDLGMAAVRSRADYPEACVLAFAAGCDVLLICHDPERHEEILLAFEKEMAKSGVLQKRAEESRSRIRRVARKVIKRFAG